MLLEGLFLPLTTPFLPDGRLNLPKLSENVARYSKTPAAGLVALSDLGQPSLLSDVETQHALRSVADAAAPEKVLVAGVARDSVIHTIDLIEFASRCGYDVALVPLPSLLRHGSFEKETKTFFETIADSSKLPVILDHSLGDAAITVDVVAALARHGNIIGVMDGSASSERIRQMREGASHVRREVTVTSVFAAVTGRMMAKHQSMGPSLLSPESLSGGGTVVAAAQATANMLKTRTKVVAFQILTSKAACILDALASGAAGSMPPLAASAPQACYEVHAAWKDGDPALAALKQDRIRNAAGIVEERFGVAGIKFASDLNGYFGGRPRLPSLPLSGAEREEVETAMAGIRN